MGYDIYGEHLRKGFCEVHPYVQCEYPCPMCIAEDDERHRAEDQYEVYCREQEVQYYAEMEVEHICELFTTA